jgi:Arc/MetJ-type ribon-helix-helix transcriptional regulator
MHRIQVQLTETQERQLREMARLREVSISALIREGVEHVLAPGEADWERRKAVALASIGKHRFSGPLPPAETASEKFADALYEDILENRP